MRLLYFKLVSWLFADVIQEHLTNCIHPEFGWFWCDGEDGDNYIKQAKAIGRTECLWEVRASLAPRPNNKDWPRAGVDEEVARCIQAILDTDRMQRRLEL